MKWLEAGILFTALGVVFALGLSAATAQEERVGSPVAVAAQDSVGQALYDHNCKSCHGPAGGAPSAAMVKLMGENLGSITDPAFLAKMPDDSIMAVIQTGRGKMKPFAEKLTPEEIGAIVKFLRSYETAPVAPGPEVPEAPPEKVEEVPGS